MIKGDAFVALDSTSLQIAGFCYIESWNHGRYIANSGLIIFPKFRMFGLAKKLKQHAFEESPRRRYPEAKLFGLTTSIAVMNINSDLGYRPVTYENLTDEKGVFGAAAEAALIIPLASKTTELLLHCYALRPSKGAEGYEDLTQPIREKYTRRTTKMLRVGVIGSAGYTGGELLTLLIIKSKNHICPESKSNWSRWSFPQESRSTPSSRVL